MKIQPIAILTAEQKEAFAKGDKYYVSPFANRPLVVGEASRSGGYTTSSMSQIFAAKADYYSSRSWN